MVNKIKALLPIKENSERVVNKNFRSFCGKELYRWVLDKLIENDYIDKIIIDTDSEKLINELPKYSNKIIIVKRPENLRGGLIPMNDIIKYDISLFDDQHFLQTHCTNPLISEETIESTIKTYLDNITEYDSLFTVNTIQKRLYNKNGKPLNHDPSIMQRTQDMEEIYEENSNIFIFSKESFLKNNNRVGENPYLFKQGYIESLDIDNEEDFIITESIGKVFNRKKEEKQ